MGVRYSSLSHFLSLSLCLRNVLGNVSRHWHLLHHTPNDVETSQRDESLAMELIISITHDSVALSPLLALQHKCREHYQFDNGLRG